MAVLNTSQANCTVQVTVPVIPGTANGTAMYFRYQDSANNWMLNINGNAQYVIEKTLAGATNISNNSAVNIAQAGDVLSVTYDGSSIIATITHPDQSKTILPVNDTALQSATLVGLSLADNTARFSNFIVSSCH